MGLLTLEIGIGLRRPREGYLSSRILLELALLHWKTSLGKGGLSNTACVGVSTTCVWNHYHRESSWAYARASRKSKGAAKAR